jgi:hypothetical protein
MMYRLRNVVVLLMLPLLAGIALAQTTKTETKDVDPLALDVLRAVTQPIEQAKALSFKALVSEEELATNGQIVTFFHTVSVTLQRPDKIHLTFQGRGHRVEFYGSDGKITMYAPDVNLYTTMATKSTIDATLDDMNAKGADIPIGPFLRDDGYKRAAANVITGYVIGRVKLFDQDVHQLAFTAPDADWQIWVTGGENPRIIRVEIVNKKLEGKPRTNIQFLDWDLNPSIAADEFTFTKPADAQQIDMLLPGGK